MSKKKCTIYQVLLVTAPRTKVNPLWVLGNLHAKCLDGGGPALKFVYVFACFDLQLPIRVWSVHTCGCLSIYTAAVAAVDRIRHVTLCRAPGPLIHTDWMGCLHGIQIYK